MKFGVCVGTDTKKMKYIKSLGFDYAEGHCQSIASASKEELDEIIAVGLPVICANCFIGMPVVGPEKDEEKIGEYIGRLFENASYLGMRYLVFGSSAARRIPEGITLEQGREEIVGFLKNHVAPMAEKYNITIAIEPLRPEECNAVNTIEDGVEIAKKVNSPFVKVLADVAHMYVQNEPVEKLLAYKGWIVHAHTSNPDPNPSFGKKRLYPAFDDAFSQKKFIDSLKSIGVESCSIEADVIDFESDAKKSFDVLKEYR